MHAYIGVVSWGLSASTNFVVSWSLAPELPWMSSLSSFVGPLLSDGSSVLNRNRLGTVVVATKQLWAACHRTYILVIRNYQGTCSHVSIFNHMWMYK